MNPFPARYAYRFTLRAVFIAIAVGGLLLSRVAWMMHRDDAIHGPAAIGWNGNGPGKRPWAPGGLWLLGEQGYPEIHHSRSLRPEGIARLKLLFPEAAVMPGAEDFPSEYNAANAKRVKH
jgi:hypothetical protein